MNKIPTYLPKALLGLTFIVLVACTGTQVGSASELEELSAQEKELATGVVESLKVLR